MSNIQTGAERMPHYLSHLGFLAGQIGRLITISTTPVIAGDSFEMDAVGALRLSPLRRGLAIDSTVVITFLVSMQISISSLQTHNVNRCGRSRHLARKLSLRRKRSCPNVFEMAATETITSIILIKLIRVSLGRVRHPRRFKIVVIDIQITLKQMLRDFIGIRVNRAKKSGMVNITSSVNSRERSGINTILHELNPLFTI